MKEEVSLSLVFCFIETVETSARLHWICDSAASAPAHAQDCSPALNGLDHVLSRVERNMTVANDCAIQSEKSRLAKKMIGQKCATVQVVAASNNAPIKLLSLENLYQAAKFLHFY